ncbi:tRNA (adenosine(37)-N6)-dimethylallyltransferase MiaA [Microbulbifer hydrolyticus]|uniref:tRNA dimethylallyltransferase n=1 Tax=Microbulbifer hydrolyticus TaxID=48074 RepID=A0A6P1T9A0_9GAMM|nr:tRNA (adenosine(37)-N6)-dimethylallyltransferase MiaA [Microbulbifer hydrolyticus]MBB5211426.1 tRNA dimethylallyltransferase [Microbulbifer hydrolyticus]QHQ37819.1 tRNA (adenosine(37)-N6)-dimethylallyltransferase MiaA [Microbulbifer hydrolyticus]
MTFSNRPRAIFLMGPTASGKTDLAMAISDHLPVELISVDSALVYRGLDIGSAKPTPEELARYPHRLIDICDPAESYSAGRFREDALKAMAEISSAGKIPLLVGGTMLYFKALLQGMAEMPQADPEFRAQIEARAEKEGWPALHAELQKVDPALAAELHPNHSVRIERALEVYHLTGKTMTQLRAEQDSESLHTQYDIQQLAIVPDDRSILHRRIAERFERMLENGFIEEVKALRARGDLHRDLPAIRAVGYRQVWEYLDGETDYQQMVDAGIAATRQLAKRQLTWLRRWPDLKCIHAQGPGGKVRNIDEMLLEALKFIG